jgi:glucose-6-phosphate isomerase
MTDDLLAAVEVAGGLAVLSAAPDPTAAATRRELIAAGVPGLLAGQDPTLWGGAAETVARQRLGWVDAYRRSRELLPQLAELCAELADLDEVVVSAPAFAASAITRTLDVPLTVLPDDPARLRDAIGSRDRLDRTVVVLTGGDDYLRRAFAAAHRAAGRTDAEASRHFVVVGPPDDQLTSLPCDPHAPGPWGALSASALVPAALAGVDVAELLDQAELLAPTLAQDDDNPALALGVALGTADGRVTVTADGTGLEGLGEWAADLLGGVIGVVVDGGADLTVTYGGSLVPGALPGGETQPDIAVNGPLGAQFLVWQYACAVAGRIRGRNPFLGHGTGNGTAAQT